MPLASSRLLSKNREISTVVTVFDIDASYRREVIIDNTKNSNNLTDYQILVTLDTASLISAGKMRSDCGDIRFTDSDGKTLLNYWIEGPINSQNTKIWVKVPNIPANSTKTIYLYYGNPDATSLSNPDDTMELTFIRGYHNSIPPTWTVRDSSKTYIDSNGYLYTWSNFNYHQYARSTRTFSFSAYEVRFRFAIKGDVGEQGSFFVGFLKSDQTLPDGVAWNWRGQPGGAYTFSSIANDFSDWRRVVEQSDGSSGTNVDYVVLTNSTNIYYTQEWYEGYLRVFFGSRTEYYIVRSGATSGTNSGTLTYYPPPKASYYFYFDVYDKWPGYGPVEGWLDYLIIRKYTYPEPTVSLGTEEYGIVGRTMNIVRILPPVR